MFRSPTTDLIIVLVIVLLILGPKRLPTLGRSIGHGLREFRESITGDANDSDHDERPEIARRSAPAPPASAPAAARSSAPVPPASAPAGTPESSDAGSERGA